MKTLHDLARRVLDEKQNIVPHERESRCFTVSSLRTETLKQCETWLAMVPERAAILIADAGCHEKYADPLAMILEAPCPVGAS